MCGHLACLFCYSCREFEQKSSETGQCTSISVPNTTNTLNSAPVVGNSNNSHAPSNIPSSSQSALTSPRTGNEFAVYRMQMHSRRCHSGYSLILRIRACRVLLLSDQGRRLTEVSAPYRDSFGELDPGLKYKKIFFKEID